MQPPHGQRHQNPAPVVQRLNPQEQQAYKELLGRLEGHGNLNDLHSPFVQKHNPEQLLFQRERIHVSASEIPQPNKLYHPLQLFDLSHDGNFARAGIPHRRHLPYGIPKPKQADNPYEHAQIQNRLIQRRNPQKRYHNPNAQQGDGDVTLSDYEKLSNDQKQLVDLTEEAHQHNSCMLGKGSFGSVFAIHASSLAAEKGGGEVTAVKRQECNRGKTHLARAELRMVRTLSGIPGASRFICQALNTAAVRREQDIFYMEMPLASCVCLVP